MSTAIMVLVLVAFLPYLLAGLGGYSRIKQLGSMDNENPRLQSAELTGAGARIVAAQANAWEALALYSATLLVVFLSGVPMESVALPAMIFGASRVLHLVMYIANRATLRSIVFVVGFGSCIYMISKGF
ncbi:MAG: MAPEG family protein [Gammaproteobacteria bacterium]|nr:MAPEG family protein [Gammaproteobacteria bacterium]NNM10445.1 MAPEG family protein [Pseudomonadales bacterium]